MLEAKTRRAYASTLAKIASTRPAVPAEPWNEVLRLSSCGLMVAAGMAPIALVGGLLARRSGKPLLPAWKPWRVPWTGFEVLLAFLILGPFLIPPVVSEALSRLGFFTEIYGPEFLVGPPPAGVDEPAELRDRTSEANVVRMLWSGLLSFPLQLGLLAAARYGLYTAWKPDRTRSVFPARLALVGVAWLGLSVVVHAVHLAVNLSFNGLGWTPEEHALTRLGGRPALDRVLFAFEACVRAPVVEELFFRGVLLPWLFNRTYRVWPVLAAAAFMALLGCLPAADPLDVLKRGPIWFALLLAVGWVGLSKAFPRRRRTLGAVWASSALFAAVHSSVWPTPIPLFVLGVGLGWVALRVRGWMVPAAVHGLFNAVSVLFVLRG